MTTKRDLVKFTAAKLHNFGYRVFIAKSGEHGFYTDDKKVVCFGGTWSGSLDFSGNYRSNSCGTGWKLAGAMPDITEDQAAFFIAANPPGWATKGELVHSTTLEQHLKIYQTGSGYAEFAPNVLIEDANTESK